MRHEIAVVLEIDGSRRDVMLGFGDPRVTVGDVMDALELEGRPTVDGRPVERSWRLVEAGVRRGSALVLGEPIRVPDDPTPPDRGGVAALSQSGTEPWVRGPRRNGPFRPRVPSRPGPPATPEAVVRPASVTFVVPVALAIFTAVLWNPMFAIFALVAPVVSLATWLDAERRHRSRRRSELSTHAGDRMSHAVRMRVHRRTVRVMAELANPTATAVVVWPERRDRRLWERRSTDDDFMRLRLGRGRGDGVVTVPLGAGTVVGVVGSASARMDTARALVVQAASHHGPADCRLGLVADPATWQWVKWLPHLATDDADLAVATEPGDRRLANATFVVCDEPPDPVSLGAFRDRGAVVLVLADRAEALPGSTGLVLDVSRGVVWTPGSHGEVELKADSLDEQTAHRFARKLARFHDPERMDRGELPRRVRLVELLDGIDAEDISMVWKRTAAETSWAAPIGIGPDGIVEVDLRLDGPHALVGGTTGAGKSELLRTLVVSLATSLDPGRCNFVLIDYKGGSAFDACADLPHTVGLVTDLDEGLAERALICLDAELRRRETVLRSAGVSSLDDLTEALGGPRLPRLVVVVDEFAAMAAELPDFVDRLVDVAQRGRSLGIHLVLATQRPSGVVSESIRANTDLRIALRVQSPVDARDVVDDPTAADIPRSRPGRAVMRLARGTTVVQTAYTGGSAAVRERRVRCRPFLLQAGSESDGAEAAGPSDLERLVESVARAAFESGVRAGPSPWPPPLPDEVYRTDLPSTPSRPVIGVVDDPARQRRTPLEWSPDDGHLLLFGLPGSGTTTALATLVLAVSDGDDPPHVYVVEGEERRLRLLEGLGNVGAVVGVDDDERLLRLVRMLGARRVATSEGGAHPEGGGHPTVLVVDGLDVVLDALEAIDPTGEASSIFTRLMSEGSGGGVSVVASAHRPSGVPHRLLAMCPRRLVFALADRYDYRALGCSRALSDPVPGRALDVGTGCEVQVALPGPAGLAAAVRSIAANPSSPGVAPPRVEALPTVVHLGDLPGSPDLSGHVWRLPFALEDRGRGAASLGLEPGVRVLVAGPARSGKSTALRSLAAAAHSAGLGVLALTAAGSPLGDAGFGRAFTDQAAACAAVEDSDERLLVLIDDAGLVDAARLVEVAGAEPLRIRIVAAGQTTRLRSRYGSWTADFGRDGVGLLIGARPRDGELLGVRLPARSGHLRIPGRGWLVDGGRSSLVQVALSPT